MFSHSLIQKDAVKRPHYVAVAAVLSLAVLALMVTAVSVAEDSDAQSDGYYFQGITYTFNGNTACVSETECNAKVIIIPSKVTFEGKDYSVTAIGDKAFYKNENLCKVYLPTSIKKIGNSAFYYNVKLTSIELPYNVNKIGASAFAYSGLTSIKIPMGASIGDHAFEFCKNLDTVNLNYGYCKNIGKDAFYCCTNLKTVKNFGSNLEEIGDRAFYGCYSLKDISLPTNLKRIGASAFSDCKINSIDIPDNVSEIGAYAFSGNNFESIDIPSKITILEQGVFSSCSILKKINIPDNIETIKEYAFEKCTGLKEVSISSCVQAISNDAFGQVNISQTAQFYKADGITQMTDLSEIIGLTFVGGSHEKLSCTTVSCSYNLNGGTGDVSDGLQITKKSQYTIPAYSVTKNGYTFDGWEYKNKVYKTGDSINIGTSDIVLKAKWKEISYKVHFDSNGGSYVNDITYTVNQEVTLESPTKHNYIFAGWQITGDSSSKVIQKIDSGTTGDMTLCAVWTPDLGSMLEDINDYLKDTYGWKWILNIWRIPFLLIKMLNGQSLS